MSWPGLLCLEHIKRGEREVEWWLRYAERLTPAERHRISRGDYGSLVRPLEPQWVDGGWLKVASNLWIRPESPVWRRENYRIAFSVRDFRAHLVRRVPQVFDPPELDDLGEPRKPTPAAIAEARLDGNYTAAHELAIPDDNDGVPDKYLNLFAAEAQAKRALGDSEATQRRIEEIHKLPPPRRLIELQKLATERGIDLREDVKAFERRVHRRLKGAA